MISLILFIVMFTVVPRGSGLDPPMNNLTIGLIVDSNDEMSIKVIDLAIRLANIELTPYNYRLLIKNEIIEENASFYTIRKSCNLLEQGLVAIITTVRGTPSRHVSSVCSKFHIPHIVPYSRYPESLEGYPMDVRVAPDYNEFATVIYRYITRVENWQSLIIIHATENGILKYENLLNQDDLKLKLRRWKHHDQKRNKELMKELSSSKNYKHFVVDIPYWQIMEFLIMASVHNLTEPDYSFIFTDLDAGLVDIATFKINNDVNITTFSIINETHIELLRHRGPNIATIFSQIIKSERSLKKADLIHNLLTRSALLIDSVMVVAQGLQKLLRSRKIAASPMNCAENKIWNLGTSLVNAITSSDELYGTTGKVLFNAKLQRKEFNISIMELTENGFIKSGYWADNLITILPKIAVRESHTNITKVEPLRVTTKIEPPFVYYHDPLVLSDFDPNPTAWRGYCIDLLLMIGKDLGLNFSIHVVADNSYGMSLANQTNPDGSQKWSGMIGEVISKTADLVVAPMTITYEREKVVDFTTPFMSLGLSIVFLRPRPEAPGLFSFMSPLSSTVWVYVIGAYIGVGILLFVISRITPYEWLPSHPCDDQSKTETQFQLLNSLWFAVGALVRQGCDQPPQASSTRIIAGAWWFFTLIIISTYTANLAAFLTVEMMILPIKGAEDLAGQTEIKYGTLRGGSSFAFFEKAMLPLYRKMYAFMTENPDVLQDDVKGGIMKVLKSNGKYAFLMESSWIDYYVQRECPLMRVGDPLDSKGYGIAFPEGSPLRDLMSESILKLQKDHVLENLKHKWWNEMNISQPCNMNEPGSIPPLGIHRVGGAFILLVVGFVVGALVALVEQYIRYRQGSLREETSFCHFIIKELKFAMRFKSSSKKLKQVEKRKGKQKPRISLLPNSDYISNNISSNVQLPKHRNSNHIEFYEFDGFSNTVDHNV